MSFYIKPEVSDSKCNGCVHAMIVKPKNNNVEVTKCMVLNMFVGPIKECNQFTPHIHSPIPMHLLMNAWLLGNDDKRSPSKHIGFKPPAILSGKLPDIVQMEEELADDE